MTTATATTPSPLESYREGRDRILNVVLDAVSGLEGSVLDFMHDHEGKVRSASFALSQSLSENGRLERLVGEQALALDESRSHVCPVPEFTDVPGVDSLDTTVAAAAPVASEDTTGAEEAARTIAELRGSLEAERRISAGLRTDLAAEQKISAGLRADLADRDGRIESLEEGARVAEKKLLATVEAHQEHVRDTQENFDSRLAAGVSAAETGVRGEAIRIIEAIAADNPALAAAADLFTVAFPAEASTAGSQGFAAPAPATAAVVAPVPPVDFFASIPAAEPAAPEVTDAVDWDTVPAAPAPAESVDFVPAPEAEAAPAPMTQVYMAAPDLEDDAILDPNFFDTPQPLEAPAGEAIQAPAPTGGPVEAPKPGYGLFGRKKEHSGV
jgi:hypothetical protein